ncbi:hypothetical protein EV426DRAFT_602464 [Tirmania nivea]|nr:hypothetical protein EV426DRAFT_602464 [Tirmania nivea]
MDQLHLIFGQVQMLLEGHAQKTLSRRGLMLLPLHHLMTILSGCVLVHSSLDKKLSKVAGLVQKGGATTRSAGLGARVQWALWGEAEAGEILVELERHKSSLHMMLTIIQCNSMKEANQSMEEQLATLHKEVEKISDKISETHSDVAVQLRELISRRHDTNDDDDTSGISSLPITTSSTISYFKDNDSVSIRSTSSSFSIYTVRSLIPSWTEELKDSRPYKRLWRRGVGLSSDSVFSKDSRATKGDTWSMLSDMSLGDLSISEISVLELPIFLSDLYDPIPYQVQQSTRKKQARRVVKWSSRGRLHRAIREGNIFTF